MPTLTWLHLSDLHFRVSREYDIEIILKALKQDLQRLKQDKGLQPDLVFFTGDIVFSGKKEQYDQVGLRFFDALLAATCLDKDRLFIVPGNHDVDRSRVHRSAYHMVQDIESDTVIKELFDDPDELRLIMRRMDNYADFARSYRDLPFSDEQPYYVQTLEVSGCHIAVIGLNSAWTSGAVKDQGELLLGRHLVAAAIEEAIKDSPDIVVALVHHPFGWLKGFDQAQTQDFLMRRCHFILRGHLHRTETVHLENPDASAVVIASGSLYRGRAHPHTYNLVRLDRDRKQGVVHLRRYGENDTWGADTLTYRNVPTGEYTFNILDLISSVRAERLSRVESWLAQRGLLQNPFAVWNAAMEREDVYSYFVDTRDVSEELLTTCILNNVDKYLNNSKKQ